MSELTLLTTAFLAVATPLFIAVGIVGADAVRERRHATTLRRVAR